MFPINKKLSTANSIKTKKIIKIIPEIKTKAKLAKFFEINSKLLNTKSILIN